MTCLMPAAALFTMPFFPPDQQMCGTFAGTRPIWSACTTILALTLSVATILIELELLSVPAAF